MKDLTLGPFTVGIDNVSPETTMPPGALKDAVNVNLDRSGGIATRPGYRRVIAESGLHSLWTSPAKRISFCVRGGKVCALTAESGSVQTTNLYTLAYDLPVSFDDLEDGVVFCTAREVMLIAEDGSVRTLGVENPGGLRAALGATVGNEPPPLPGQAGVPSRYGFAVSFLRGNEESALSYGAYVSAVAGATIAVTLPQPKEAGITAKRVYRTPANGDVYRVASDAPPNATTWMVGTTDRLGRAATTQFLEQIPGGSIIRYWRGRVYVARRRALLFSDPMRYGLFDRRTGFVQFPAEIVMVEPVAGGIFVGTTERVYFLAGSGPGEFALRITGGKPPIAGSGTRIYAADAGGLGENLDQRGEVVALWLSRNGFVLGTSEGRLVETQRSRIHLPIEQTAMVGSTAVLDRRAISVLTS